MLTPQEIAENNLLGAMGLGRIVANKPEPQSIPLSVRVANILKKELDVGTFDDTCMKDEIELLDNWVVHTLLFDEPLEEVDYDK